MTDAIITHQDGRQEGIEISEGKRNQMYRESLSMLSQGILFGWKSTFYKAFALFNIEKHRLYEADGDGVTWEDFLEKSGVPSRSARRHLAIAERIRETIKQSTGATCLPAYITQKDFNQAFEPFFANGKDITLRGLSKSSGDLETFQKYLSGSTAVEDKEVIKLLNSKNRKTAEMREEEERRAKLDAELSSEHASFYESEAARHGLTWDEETRSYLNEDGSKMSDAQVAEMMTAVTAIRVWSEFEKILAGTVSDLERTKKVHFEEYDIYRKHSNDSAFHAKVRAKFRQTKRLMERVESLTADLLIEEEAA